MWKDQGEHIKTWAGNIGYPERHHNWYLFNHKCQFVLYLSIALYLLYKLIKVYEKHGLDARYFKAAFYSLISYLILTGYELYYYLEYGAPLTDEAGFQEFAILMGGFVISNIFLLSYNKAWK